MAVHRGPSTKWLFTREQMENTPSRRCGIEADRELSYRQQAANLIQDMGQRLNVYPFEHSHYRLGGVGGALGVDISSDLIKYEFSVVTLAS